MAREIISKMRAFANASAYTMDDLIAKVEKKELQIRDFQNQKMDLEASLDQQSITLKNKFDTLVEQENDQHSKELDDVRYSLELEKSQINS
jgi:hypothetical protein